MFEELGVTCPVGAEDLHTVDDIVAGVQSMRARRPSLTQAIVKLNEGVSGAGNASLDLHGLPAPGSSNEAAVITDRVLGMQPEAESLAVDVYLAAFEKHGGIVEERITGVALTSPSVQMRALPDGTVELLSTHDQLLGGASGQKYLGCVFPADPGYAAAIAEPAMVIGRHLAELGVLGRFAVDFVTVQDESGAWTPYAIELNLRKGGTTHPFLTLQFLTDGTYDGERGVFLTPSGTPKYLVATDHFEDDRLKALTVAELFDAVVSHGSAFRPGPPYRSGLPHDQLPHRMWSRRPHRGRRQPRGGMADLPGGAVRAPAGGRGGTRGRIRNRLSLRLGTEDLVWYVAYGSNMHAARFGCYISGGRPRGTRRTYLGCRDQSPPHRAIGVHLSGGLTFAGRSSVWGGGVAFYNPHADGEVAARAYLLTFGQFSDVVAQEVRRPVGSDLTLGREVDGRWATPSNVYETRPAGGSPGRVPDVDRHVPAEPRAHTAVGSLPSNHARRTRRGLRLDRGRAGALPVACARRHPGVDGQPTRRAVRRRALSGAQIGYAV